MFDGITIHLLTMVSLTPELYRVVDIIIITHIYNAL